MTVISPIGFQSGMTAEHLLTVADISARFLSYRFEPTCWGMIEQALSTFDPQQPLPPNDPALLQATTPELRTRLAEARVAQWVAAMVQEAIALGLTELHEPTFNAVSARLCPFFPFC
jgi:hypothetical protein